jgi:hypothetical protein
MKKNLILTSLLMVVVALAFGVSNGIACDKEAKQAKSSAAGSGCDKAAAAEHKKTADNGGCDKAAAARQAADRSDDGGCDRAKAAKQAGAEKGCDQTSRHRTVSN